MPATRPFVAALLVSAAAPSLAIDGRWLTGFSSFDITKFLGYDSHTEVPDDFEAELLPLRNTFVRMAEGALPLDVSGRSLPSPPSPPSPIATLPCGALLQGSMVPAIADGLQPVASYRGVPYAQPPVGAKRWMPPETLACPAAPGETLDVSKTPRSCWQSDGAATTCGKRNMTTSENCLTVDIYVQPKLVGASPSVRSAEMRRRTRSQRFATEDRYAKRLR